MQRIDLTGQVYGRWKVLSFGETRKGSAYWLCECECGNRKLVAGLTLRDGRSTSCGCLRIDHSRVDLTGQRFNLLTVLSLAGTRPTKSGNRLYFLCRCDCGVEKIFLGASLVYGATKSCGRCAKMTHGDSSGAHKTTEYRSWGAMLSRCQNPKNNSWKDYGGRGISVCERWQSYQAFLADMGRKPSPAHSIDRINVNGNYEPSNCRWATKREQAINRRQIKVGRIESFSDDELMAELNRRNATHTLPSNPQKRNR